MNGDPMIYIGVDGGGTKTAIGAYDASGHCLAEALCPPLNYHFIGMDAALAHLAEGLAALAIPTQRIAAIGIGDPAIDDISVGEAAMRFASAVRRQWRVPVYIRSDAYMTLYALTEGKCPGVLVISGTGAMAIAEDAQKRVHVAGGWGRLTGDEGSGYFIGLEGLRAALGAADGIMPPTILTEEALSYFGCQTPRALIDIFYGAQEPDVAGFSRVVGNCAEQGDSTAQQVLQRAARYLADYASVLIEKSGAETVGVYGSVLMKNRTVRTLFDKWVHEAHPEVSISEPSVSAQAAAARYAQIEYGKEVHI